MEKKTQFSVGYFAFAFLVVLFLHNIWVGVRTTAPIPYSEFQTLVKQGKVRAAATAPLRPLTQAA